MKPELLWTDPGLPPRREDDVKATVYSMAFNPQGTELVVAVANLVLVYATEDGDLKHRLRGHKDLVYTVSYGREGTKFASGGADSTVIIWNSRGEGVLKYTHSDSIQVVAHNPACDQLASCTESDFGLWSSTAKSVTKHKVGSKILSARWSNDGQYLALGMYDGKISIRDKSGTEYKSIEKKAPVWCLAWSPAKEDPGDLLAVGCWDQTLSFYQLSGTQHLKERKLGCYPTSLSYYPNGEYLVVGGSDRKTILCTREAVKLKQVCEIEEWVWSTAVRPRNPAIAVGSYSGSIQLWDVVIEPIYALDGDRFAVRDHMTDVVVHHMHAEKRVRIKSRDYVRKVAIYRDRLAIQLPDRINVYELHKRDDAAIDMHYRLRKDRLKVDGFRTSHLGVTSSHVLVASGAKLTLHGFSKLKEREWLLDAEITCLRVDGGPPGKEGVLLGLKDGSVLKIYVDNAFPVDVWKGENAMTLIDRTGDRRKLALVDAEAHLRVVDARSKELVFQAEGVSSCRFNAQFDDTLCYSRNDRDELLVKTGDHDPRTHKVSGKVVGFVGAKLFVARDLKIESLDVPQSEDLKQFIGKGEHKRALSCARLGVTASDWRALADSAAHALDLTTAQAAFAKVHDLRRIELLTSMERRMPVIKPKKASKRKKREDVLPEEVEALAPIFRAELQAYQGKYQDAARAFAKAGEPQKAIDLFADLRQWEEAKAFAQNSKGVDAEDLTRKQAEWAEEVSDWAAAADMHVTSGNALQAVRLLHEHKPEGWIEKLSLIVRQVSAEDVLRQCARAFLANGDDERAKEVYVKLDDVESLLGLYVRKQDWPAALKLAEEPNGTFTDETRNKFNEALYLPYAEWLAIQDKFDEALDAYRKSGREDRAARMMQQLTFNAVVESRFKDASYYYWLLASETLRVASNKDDLASAMALYTDQLHKADLYYAYAHVEDFFLPYTPLRPEVLFQCARFLINGLGGREAPHGISRAKILYTLAKQAKACGAFKLAKYAYDKLLRMKLPDAWRDEVDLDALTIGASPLRDKSDLLPVCYRCGASNALLNPASNSERMHCDVCTSCGHPFVRSFLNFEVLPLIEFVPEASISDEEALDLIREFPEDKDATAGFSEGKSDALLDEDDEDRFTRAINDTLQQQAGAHEYKPVTVDAETLRTLYRAEVFCCRARQPGMRATYYKSAIPDVHMALSQSCHRFFHEDDFEYATLKEGRCPYSRAKEVGDFGTV
jgi:intraflagellar transport protein 122